MYLGNNQCNKGYGYYAHPALHEQSQKHSKKKWHWLEKCDITKIQICEIMGLKYSLQIQLFLILISMLRKLCQEECLTLGDRNSILMTKNLSGDWSGALIG